MNLHVSQMRAAELLKKARMRAGLSQRELAERAGTAQSLISRIERGLTCPTTASLGRLLEAAGFELRLDLTPRALAVSHMLDDVERILALSPEDRLREIANFSRFETEVRS